jgi:hypothetical protein
VDPDPGEINTSEKEFYVSASPRGWSSFRARNNICKKKVDLIYYLVNFCPEKDMDPDPN